MNIVWDPQKDEWLRGNRGVSFLEIAEQILAGDYIDILENPTRENQQYFLLLIENYTWVVPFLFNDGEQIVLKTAFQSRKFHRKYGGMT